MVSKRYTPLNIKESLPVVKALIRVLTSVLCALFNSSTLLFHSLLFFDYACFMPNSTSSKDDNTSGEVREGIISCHYKAQNRGYVHTASRGRTVVHRLRLTIYKVCLTIISLDTYLNI
jgi:hypothetical protein